ncbi:N-acetylmuramoyl-L-alanine amidase [Alteribacter keqinensis]|uniref:MurNAc-LAA domain-containing protein n=1 Tax=Alteribacter keqinensis TaxID=2483800 RepID=A0A3M7TT80_9BACI|nr:N-acetylmuramoyl-L-alanine amidase [Alteribacter keqinensis]RNA68653.1 hypothetical protein EBO34_01410 [Alteribacter keqinensis]
MVLPISLGRPVRIFIDPGHGGSDPGAVGNALREKDLCLSTALRLRDILQSQFQNVEVRLSRTTDVFVSLAARAQAANSWNADLFVSIHYNAAVAAARGFETFRFTNAPNRTRQIHQEMHRVMYNQAWRGRTLDRGTKSAGFYVLRYTNMAAILTEGGFVTNAQDANFLRSSAFIQEAAAAHAEAIAALFSNVRRRSSGGSTGTGEWTGQVLRNGDRGALVRSLQEKLLNLGYDLGSFGGDGIFGNATENAVRAIQRSAGITVDGIAGPQTYQAIQNARPSGLLVIVDADTLNVRSRPSWDASAVAGTVRRGEAFTVIERVSVPGSSTDMYRLKSGLYITTSESFVRTRLV